MDNVENSNINPTEQHLISSINSNSSAGDNIDLAELEEIEKEILAEVTDAAEEKKTKSKSSKSANNGKTLNSGRASNKEELAVEIVKIYKDLGEEPPTTVGQMKRKKRAVLDELKLELLDRLEKKKQQDKIAVTIEKVKSRSSPTADPIRLMVNGNLMVARMIEFGGEAARTKTWDINVMQGFTDEIIEQEEHMKLVMAGLYEKYGEQLSPFMDPLTQYASIMITSAGKCAAVNLKKKRGSPPEDLHTE